MTSNVSLEIAGRSYTVACAEGEEAHIAMLGASIDGKLAGLPNLSNQSEARTLLFAALLMADELHEAGKKQDDAVPQIAEMLENLAGRLETLASRLESPASSP